MNDIDHYYRMKEILRLVKEYTNPFNINIRVIDEKEILAISFRSDIENKLMKDEKVNMLNKIKTKIEDDNFQYKRLESSLTGALIIKLSSELELIRNEIKKDFNIKEVIENGN